MPGVTHLQRRRGALAMTMAVMLLTLLTACSATGDGVRDSFVREFDADADVAATDLTSADGAAFSGGVSGVITAEDGLDAASLDALSERIRAHAESVVDAEVLIDLSADGWRFPVLRSAESNAEMLELIGALREDARLVSGTAWSDDHRAVPASWALVTTSPEAAVEVATTPPAGVSGGLVVHDADEALSFTGTPGAWVTAGTEAWRTVGASVSLTRTRVEEERVDVTVASEQDAARADALLGAALEGTGLAHAVSSDLVTLAPGAQGQALRALLGAVPAAERALIGNAWTDDRSAALQVKTPADAERLARVVDGPGFETITLRSTGQAPAISVTAAPDELADRVDDAVAVASLDAVVEVSAIPRSGVGVTIDADVDDAGLAAYAAAAKALSEPGERVCLDREGDGSLCVEAAEQISVDDLSSWGRRHGDTFVEAWNAAPWSY